MRPLYLAVLVAACSSPPSPATTPRERVPVLPASADAAVATTPPAPATPIADEYRARAAQIIAAATADDAAWQRLRELTDGIGHRLSGSKALEKAITWAEGEMKADGHDVRIDPVKVP